MYKTLSEQYEQLLSRYIVVIEKRLKERLDKARDKESVVQEITNELAGMAGLMTATTKAKGLIDDFLQHYRQGEDIGFIVPFLKDRYGNNTDFFESYIDKEQPLIIYDTEENKRVAVLASDERKLLKFLVQYMAVQEIKNKLPGIFNMEQIQPDSKADNLYPVQWTGSKENKNEFVQLIYALHEAGYLNKGKGEITKIIDTLAGILEVGLGKNWQSNHSASIHKSNRDYQPPIFDKLLHAYKHYADNLIEAKQSNK